MANCPRTIRTKDGKTRTVRCRSWSCPTCSAHMSATIEQAAARVFQHDAFALRIRPGNPDDGNTLPRIWARLRARIPGMIYIAVHEQPPDEHLHAIVRNTDPRALERHAIDCGATDVMVDHVRNFTDYTRYLLSKRADARAPRIMHSRHLTAPLHHTERNTDVETERTAQWNARTQYPQPDFQAHAHDETEAQPQAQPQEDRPPSDETEPQTPSVETPPAGQQQRAGDALPAAAASSQHDQHADHRHRVHALIDAAAAIGATITITVTLPPTPPTVPVGG